MTGEPADEIGREERLSRSAQALEAASRELAQMVPTLRRLAEREALRELALDHCVEITSATVGAVVDARRLRDEYFEPGLGDAAWALLLALLAARLDGRRLAVTSLSDAAEVPLTTALRALDRLAERGLIARNTDAEDERIALVTLTDEGADRMRGYLMAALRLSPWVI